MKYLTGALIGAGVLMVLCSYLKPEPAKTKRAYEIQEIENCRYIVMRDFITPVVNQPDDCYREPYTTEELNNEQ